MTVTVAPAIVSVPFLVFVVDGFAATENVTGPGPIPDEPAVIVIHESLLAADHAQVAAAFTDTL